MTGQNKRGRWRAEWLDGEGKGTLIGGTEPDGVEVGSEYEVRVKRASSRMAFELEWG